MQTFIERKVDFSITGGHVQLLESGQAAQTRRQRCQHIAPAQIQAPELHPAADAVWQGLQGPATGQAERLQGCHGAKQARRQRSQRAATVQGELPERNEAAERLRDAFYGKTSFQA